MARSYEQYCGLAQALDLVGERWTLMIVRELMAGPRRYTDLADGLMTVPTNVLAARLREMQANGLVRRRRLPVPAASIVYELTEDGESLLDAVTELARWGMRRLPATTEKRPFRAHWLVLALRARFDSVAATGVSETYEFDIAGDAAISFELADGEGRASVGSTLDPAVRITADADTLIALTGGAIGGPEALARGARIEGDPVAIERMQKILPTRALGSEPAAASPSDR